MRIEFKDLSPKLQERIQELAYSYYTIKGLDHPKKLVQELSLKKKKRKTWNSLRWWFMTGIDSHREKMGLERLYSKIDESSQIVSK